ncbi:hypothetical protein CYLTODRAFT_183523 [Cylindrobasidium torrendii FP15055 ss-10]|uniref:Uncharacterized protein n=1 Tax=Cylindrobasidium torrendii FP15055 ss-10 TaxID=1314674 RepID=A0A0D7AV30_9AGAR|nr:hypothetical protein CYLTODRAFT_183523 [Cylindrobasidium torrendii FP15055 ss-10]
MDVDGASPPELADDNLYYPFASKLDWDVARWMVTEGIGHGSFNRLLEIEGVKERLGLSYPNTRGLHQRVDEVPSRAGRWHTKKITFPDRPDEVFTFRHRNILEAVESLLGDPELAEHLVYKPRQMFHQPTQEGESRGARFYNEMWTGKWWWYIQNMLPKGRTLVPLIIATDKTQLTQFSGSRQAYPVYLTLGNIPNSLRRKPSQQACILLAYLPVDKLSRGKLSKASMGARYQRLFHTAMRVLVEPLIKAGKDGVAMTSGDGQTRTIHPILAAYVADYPEQCLVTCSKYGSCPKCTCPPDNLQDSSSYPNRTPEWTRSTMDEARASTTSTSAYSKACKAKNVNGNVSKPFWENLPYTDIHLSTTPDVLHQLYQGVLQHLIAWCQELMTEAELDRRVRCLPPGLGLRHFKNGFSALSQISGTERKNMGKILLGCIADVLDDRAVTACRAVLNFIYLAQYSTHDDETLQYMDDALALWHANKDYFTHSEYGVREHINIPKFHSLQHYVTSIRYFGTTNNFNTEMFERLHIDFAKKGWRASNHRDEFPQMTVWISRQENVKSFERYVSWAQHKKATAKAKSSARSATASTSARDSPNTASTSAQDVPTTASTSAQDAPTTASTSARDTPTTPSEPRNTTSKSDIQGISLSKNPTAPNKALRLIEREHHIPAFPAHLCSWLNAIEVEHANQKQRDPLHHHVVPFSGLDTWHSFKFGLEGFDESKQERDWVKASPLDGGRFDTVIVLHQPTAQSTSLEGTRIGRVRVIFRLPVAEKKTRSGPSIPFPKYWPKVPHAYVQWYTAPRLTDRVRKIHNMPSVKKAFGPDGVTHAWSIIPLSNICQSCMLFPDFGRTAATVWDTNACVLDTCSDFLVNNWLSLFTYQTVYM